MVRLIGSFYKKIFELIGRGVNDPNYPNFPEDTAFGTVAVLSSFNFLSLYILVKVIIFGSAWSKFDNIFLGILGLLNIGLQYFLFRHRERYKKLGIRLDIPLSKKEKLFLFFYCFISIITLVGIPLLARLFSR